MGRGPSYPYVDLEQAIAVTRKVYDYAKRGAAPTEGVISEALKYSPTSSGAQKMIAALRSFGLVEDAPGTNGKAIKLTPRSIRILLDEPNSAERIQEIKKAALSPKWYEYCWKKWGKDIPPAMKSNLLIEHGFVDSTIDGFLKDYRKTIAFSGLLDDVIFEKSDESTEEGKKQFPKIGDYVQWESRGVLQMPAAKKLTRFSPKGDFAFVEGSETGIPIAELIAAEPPEEEAPFKPQDIFIPAILGTPAQGAAKMQTDVVSLRGEMTLQLQWPATISQEAYDDLVDQLDLIKKRAKRAIGSFRREEGNAKISEGQ